MFSNFILKHNFLQPFFKNIPLANVKIKNSNLAKELDQNCRKNGEILTYSEYSKIAQYGNFGYYNSSPRRGKTNVHKRWGKALLSMAERENIKNVVELGCGDGSLGVSLEGKIKWWGIEVQKELHETVKENFTRSGIPNNLYSVNSALPKKIEEKSLVVFPYSLDSLPPEIFINTKPGKNPPDSIIGIKISNGKLKETLLSFGSGLRYDLTKYKLHTGQRLYLSLKALDIVWDLAKTAPSGSLFVFIDEFRPGVPFLNFGPLGLPKDLYAKSKDCTDISKYYQTSGKDCLYYPMYLSTYTNFLFSLGFTNLTYDFEEKLAANIVGNSWLSLRATPHTFAIMAKSSKPKEKIVKLSFPSIF